MTDFNRIDISKIHIGVCYSEPVFFEDGKNMFLAAGKTAKMYHVAALKQWKIPFLLTRGKEIDPNEYVPSKALEPEPLDVLEEL